MTVDRTALRRLSDGITPLGCPPRMDVACRLAAAAPALLDELDAKDRRIAELESDLLAATEQADSWRTQAQELAIRVEVATDLNVGDRKRIAELEAGLREAIGWIPHPHFATINRLRKLLPSEET